jgi:hypothetical protein
MSIRPVLRAVARPSAEIAYLRSFEEQTPRVRVSGTCRIAIMYLEGPGFMQRDEFPANIIFGNSVIQIPRRQTIITTQSDFEDETA